jgi:glycogen synthase
MPERIAIVTYETPYAPCGGVAAVLNKLPGHLSTASGAETTVITPYHRNIEATSQLATELAGELTVPLNGAPVTVKLLCHLDQNGQRWLFLAPDSPDIFAGKRHPFDVGADHVELARRLRRDSLFFGASVARSLHAIAPGCQWTLLLQDWEAATAALALATQKNRHRLHLTLHNSYDSGAVNDRELESVGIDPGLCSGPPGLSAATVLERALQIVRKPIFTVSEQYARDLTSDPVQVKVMAPQLLHQLRGQLLGIDNGPFRDLAVNQNIIAKARQGTSKPLLDWKAEMREKALRALTDHRVTDSEPVWGDPDQLRRGKAPWIMMAGRDDSRQKGYDVAAAAIDKLLAGGARAKFLLLPNVGDEGLQGLSFIESLARSYPDRVLAFPFYMGAGYIESMSGAAYGLMPSLYEPFGMAHELYLNGTVGIARATGGITEQIVPLRAAAAFSQAVQRQVTDLYPLSAEPTGILFREADDIPSAVDDWKAINATGYLRRHSELSTRLAERRRYPLFRAMVDQLALAIADGLRIYRDDPGLYARMLARGIDHVRQTFSWQRAAAEYARQLENA